MSRSNTGSEEMVKRRFQGRGVRRRELLIGTLEEMLMERTISDIRYQEIADKAGIPLPSCYNLFANKLDLVQAVSESYGERYVDHVFAPLPKSSPPEAWTDLTDIMIDRSIEFIHDHPATRAIWFGADVPPKITLASRIRERQVASQYKEFVGRYFKLPQIDELDDIFYLALEIADRVIQLSEILHGEITPFYVREAKRLQRAYLGLYLFPFAGTA